MNELVQNGAGQGSASSVSAPALFLKGIDKSFGAVHANRGIDLRVEHATVHGIVGENGAGKSTLMRIVFGFYKPDDGVIEVDGVEQHFKTPKDAMAAGIGMVHQHFMLVENFTVLENVILGLGKGIALKPQLDEARAKLVEIEQRYGLEVDPDALIEDLSVGERQRVEILKALYRDAQILILDEPTGVLTPQEADRLFEILGTLKAQGRSVLLITHKLKEIMAITDQVSIMRQGEMVAHRATAKTSREELAELMVGKKVALPKNEDKGAKEDIILSLRDVEMVDGEGVRRLKDISLDVHAGEILGIAGVAGNGQSELLEAVAGMRPITSGEISLKGQRLLDADHPSDPLKVRHQGVGHVPEDCQKIGLVRAMRADENIILGFHKDAEFKSKGLLDLKAIKKTAQDYFEHYDVRPRIADQLAGDFSGGNQQKIAMAREVEHDPDLLLVGQPTRGVDIGAVAFIHSRLLDLKQRGKALLLVSADLDELLALSDRILVMCDGAVVGEAVPGEVSEQELGLMMAGVSQ
ncbi:MAG: ABC transporter ATP-binding protein [Sphingomonadales bacterium]